LPHIISLYENRSEFAGFLVLVFVWDRPMKARYETLPTLHNTPSKAVNGCRLVSAL
jgi:hypothetical protein